MKKTLVALVALSLALALAAGCTKNSSDGNLMVYHGSHRDDVKTLDPANAYDTISLDIVPNIYETLYQYDYLATPYRVVPLLAADMPKYSSDRLTVTIPIKRGIKFQDDAAFKQSQGKGRELKAQDFVYGMKRLALPSLQAQGWWVLDGKIKGINEFHDKLVKTAKGDVSKAFTEEVEGIKAIDDYTLQLKLTKPYPQLQWILAMSFTAPVPAEAVEAYGDENGNLTEHPVGTGPFILKEWRRQQKIVLERNPSYHPEFYPTEGSDEFRKRGLLADAGKPLPFLDRVEIQIVKEEQPSWLKFLKGELDAQGIPKDNFSSAIKSKTELSPELAAKGMRLSIETSLTFFYISFNMKDKLIGSNKALRQAFASAINRDEWIEIFMNGRAIKQTTALPPGVPGRVEKAQLKYDFDPARAKELLKKAGYPDGQGLPVLNFDMRGADSTTRQLGDFLTRQLSAVGIKLNVIYNTFPAYLEKTKQGNHQVSMGGWGLDYPDGENVFQLLYGPNMSPGPADSNFNHPEMNKLYEQMALMADSPARSAIIAKMDEILQEEVPWALGYYRTNYYLSHPWLLNYRPSDMLLNTYKYFRINKDVKERYLRVK